MMATKRKVAKKVSTRKQTAGAPASVQVAENTDDVRRLLKVLCDSSKRIEVRMAALQSLGAAAFSVANFELGSMRTTLRPCGKSRRILMSSCGGARLAFSCATRMALRRRSF